MQNPDIEYVICSTELVKFNDTAKRRAWCFFLWTVPSPPANNEVICSPAFEKWGRKWWLVFQKKGNKAMFGFEYVQGVEQVHLAVRYVCNN